MVPRKKGLIVNITSLGGLQYAFNVAYGVGKAGVDRLSTDCGIELKKQNVACLGKFKRQERFKIMINNKQG